MNASNGLLSGQNVKGSNSYEAIAGIDDHESVAASSILYQDVEEDEGNVTDDTIYSPARPTEKSTGFLGSMLQSFLSNSKEMPLNVVKMEDSGTGLGVEMHVPNPKQGNEVEEESIEQHLHDHDHAKPDIKKTHKKHHPHHHSSKRKGHSNPVHRMVDRDGDFHQSRGKISIRKKIRRRDWRNLYGYDLFHSMVNAPTSRTIFILLLVYFLTVVFFAILYYFISTGYGCNLDIETYAEAFAFSLETMATVGYGTQDIFFDDCLLPIIVLTIQMLIRIISDAVTIGIIYSRLARPTTRASTILFSNFSIIRRIRGKLYYMFQLCELRKHQLVEAHVRLYTMKQEVEAAALENSQSNLLSEKDRVYFQTCTMRLNHPNDETGSMILMCMPQLVVHEIDASSPLYPPPRWIEARKGKIHNWKPPAYEFANIDKGQEGPGRYDPRIMGNLGFPSISERNPYLFHGGASDKAAKRSQASKKEREAAMMDDTGQSPCRPRTASKTKSLQDYGHSFSEDVESNIDTLGLGSDVDKVKVQHDHETSWQKEEREMVEAYMRDRRMEVIAVVEGMDSATGGVVQARHSFVLNEIKWNRTFVPCVYEDGEEGVAVVDFSLFHKLQPVLTDSPFPGIVSSNI